MQDGIHETWCLLQIIDWMSERRGGQPSIVDMEFCEQPDTSWRAGQKQRWAEVKVVWDKVQSTKRELRARGVHVVSDLQAAAEVDKERNNARVSSYIKSLVKQQVKPRKRGGGGDGDGGDGGNTHSHGGRAGDGPHADVGGESPAG